MDNKREFGSYLKSMREEKQITLRGLAKKLNISPAYLFDIEKGNRTPPRIEYLKQISSILKLTKLENNTFFDKEGKSNNDIPSDIKQKIISNNIYLELLREIDNMDDNNKQEIIGDIKALIKAKKK